MEKSLAEQTEGKEEQLQQAYKDRDSAVKELQEMKSDFARKMNEVKLLEMELETKLAEV